ncbi:MAG: hypothetical protein WB239_02545, partial [Acidimicrobiia bacterium]
HMNAAAVAVAIVFGSLLGWGLRGRLDDRRPGLAAMLVGLVIGAGALFGSGEMADMASGSLLLGCGAGLILLVLPRRRHVTG